jgi:hypothetical protein
VAECAAARLLVGLMTIGEGADADVFSLVRAE